jgi:hypothetical protein
MQLQDNKIVQVTLARNELTLIKHMLPLWSRYVDGFVFMLDRNTDATKQYLESVRDQYNILEVLESNDTEQELSVETNIRQRLFDTGRKYANHIICLDADEYLDGELTKQDLQHILDSNPNTIFHLRWVQYTSVNTIRIDGPWLNNFKDRIGTYNKAATFLYAQMHSTHLPFPENQATIDPEKLFIAHMQWVNKTFVAIKQYFWKTTDYVNSHTFGVQVAGNDAYDASVNNFDWEEEYTFTPMKINPVVFEQSAIHNNYRLSFIKEQTAKHNIPNLGSWGYDFMSMDETKPYDGSPYKVSVITAIGPIDVYGKFIPRYLQNVTSQHFFSQTEHIIVYSEWCDAFEEFTKYPNFKLVKEDEKKGVYNAWNIGIKEATTDLVTNWNIDDIRHPINTKIKYDAIVRNNVDIAYNWYHGTTDSSVTFENLEDPRPQVLFPDEYEKYALEACLVGPDPMWKKSLHDQVGYFDYEQFNTIGDWEMWIRFAKAGAKFKLIPEVLCIYLDHDSTVSRVQLDRVASEKQRLYQKYK